MRRYFCVIILCLCFCATKVSAQQTVTVDALELARVAISTGNYDAAREVLDVLLKNDPSDVEANFLMAELAAAQGDLDSALSRFTALLIDHPDLVRARLDYAAVLFRVEQDDRAEYNFRLTLAAELPDAVRANVMQYLHLIQARRRYQVSVAASIAPDTNINNGISANEINLFGLPFVPDQKLKTKSGTGIVFSVAGEYRYPITGTMSWRTNAMIWGTNYLGSGAFNDNIFRAASGPQWLSGSWGISALGVYTQRWYGSSSLYHGTGVGLEAAYSGFSRWRLEGSFENLELKSHSENFMDGNYITLNFYPNYYFSATSFLRPIIGYLRQDVSDPTYSNSGYRAGLGFHQEYSRGISADFQGEVFLNFYNSPNPSFGTTRHDQTFRALASVYKRDWIIFAFNPVLTVIHTRNKSNQDLYSYSRTQFQIGFTKQY